MVQAANTPRIGFLVKTYPKLSETFILGEILGLEERQAELCIYALQRPTDDCQHADSARVRAPVCYLPESISGNLPEILLAHAGLLVAHPLRYVGALIDALRRREPAAGRNFLLSGWLATRLLADRVVHLHAHFACLPATIAEQVRRMSGIPYSISAHAKDIYLSEPQALGRRLANAEFTVTCTEHNRRYLASIAPATARVHRMYHGIDAARFCRGVPGRPAAATPPVLLSVGRLREKKGLDVLIDACALLRDAGRDFECRIIGYGPQEAELRDRIETAGLADRVRLLGKLDRDQVIENYRAASAFVLPCRVLSDGDRDGIPNVLLEAMAMELPVVSTTVSGIPEAVRHGENGLLVEPGNPSAIADALSAILDDPALGERLGREGRRAVIQDFSTQNLGLLLRLLPCRMDRGLPRLHGELGAANECNH